MKMLILIFKEFNIKFIIDNNDMSEQMNLTSILL